MVCTDRYSIINICSLHFNEAICRNVKPLILPPTSVRGGAVTLWPQIYPPIFLELNQSNDGSGDYFNLIDKRIR